MGPIGQDRLESPTGGVWFQSHRDGHCPCLPMMIQSPFANEPMELMNDPRICDRRSTYFLVGVLATLWLGGGLLVPPMLLAQETEGNPAGSPQEQGETDATRPASSADLVSVDLRLDATPLPAGETVEAALVVDIQNGWHVNAHRPTFNYLIGTAVTWESSSDMTVGKPRYPEAKRLELDFAGQAIDVYEGRVAVFTSLRPSASARPGERTLTGRLRVQACNDRTCLQPSTVTVSRGVPVASAGTAPTPTGDPIFDTTAPSLSVGTVVSILRQYGFLLAGGVLVLGTILVLFVLAQNQPSEPDTGS